METIKKTALVICISLMTATGSFAQMKSNFTIHGNLKDIEPMPAKVYLTYATFLNHPIDSAVVSKGNYSFKGYTPEAIGAELSLSLKPDPKSPKNKVTLILDKGELNITSTGTMDNITVTGSGSKAENDFKGVTDQNHKMADEINKLMQTEQYKTDAQFKRETMSKYYGLISSALNNLIIFSRKNPTSPATPFMTYMLVSSNMLQLPMQDTLLRNLPAVNPPGVLRAQIALEVEKRNKKMVEAAEAAAAKRKANDEKVPLGTNAMEFTVNNTEGIPVSLSSFKGKYVLVDFWASWCVPCRGENPNVVKAYEQYKDKNFTVLGISLDTEAQKAAWLAAIKKDGLAWTQVSDLKGWKSDVAKLYSIESIPQNFLIDPNGVIIAKNLRGEELQKKLASILK